MLSANQALGFGFVLFLPLKIILFLPPAENHKRESGAIKTAELLNLVSLNWFPAILSGPQASLTATSALRTSYSALLSLPLGASAPDFTIEADAHRLRLFVSRVSFTAQLSHADFPSASHFLARQSRSGELWPRPLTVAVSGRSVHKDAGFRTPSSKSAAALGAAAVPL